MCCSTSCRVECPTKRQIAESNLSHKQLIYLNEFIRRNWANVAYCYVIMVFLIMTMLLVRGNVKWEHVKDIFGSFVSVTPKSINEDALIFVCLCGSWNTVTQQRLCLWVYARVCVCAYQWVWRRVLERNKYIVWLFSLWNNTESHESCCKDITTGSTHGTHIYRHKRITESTKNDLLEQITGQK